MTIIKKTLKKFERLFVVLSDTQRASDNCQTVTNYFLVSP